MAESSESLSAAGYTRESVDAYKQAAAAERQRIEAGIAAARERADLARARIAWLDDLEDVDDLEARDDRDEAINSRGAVTDAVNQLDEFDRSRPASAGPSLEFG
ncbi:MAG: hypothetical protein JO368_05925 [Acidimicrobiales bacterium]|nr:hypothetical protein [Acidimicrobiales bacterium]